MIAVEAVTKRVRAHAVETAPDRFHHGGETVIGPA